MINNKEQILIELVEFLKKLCRENIQTQEAKTRLRLLQIKYPDLKMDLVWEEEEFDKSIHYDVLLHLDQEGTVSLSYCLDRVLPWPLRGVHRWSEMDLLRVNNTVLTVEQAIAHLDVIWNELPILKRLINSCLIRETLDEEPIHLSDTELQQAIDGFRRAHKLYTVEDTYRWMEEHGMTHEKLEAYAANQAMVAKLRDQVTTNQVKSYFDEHRADFETAYIAQLEFLHQESANQIYQQICSNKLTFYEAAQQHFLMSTANSKDDTTNLFTSVRKGELSSSLRTAIFVAQPGDIIGPIKTDNGCALFHILSFASPILDERTQNTIAKILFDDWLAQRQQLARIEWYWGKADQTSQLVPI